MSNIIQEIRSGNKDAVKQVYQEYAKDVYNFAKSITGDHDSALAATKKTFLILFKNIQNGDEPANLRTAALKLAYDEAYKMVAPQDASAVEPAQDYAPAPAPVAEPVREEQDIYAEPMFQPRTGRATQAPVVNDEYEEEYDNTYEEEEDDFVPPSRPQDADRDEVYIPQGGYDTLKIEPVDVDEEAAEMRGRRRRPADEFEEEAPRRRRRAPEEEEAPRRRRSQDTYEEDSRDRGYDDDYYDDDYEDDEDRKPRNKGLFIFCIILNVILILILLWFLGGLLVNLGVLPDIDIGYSWFNSHIYPLF